MKVVINQSNYLPWKGYFDLIHDADLFIFLDDVQYTKNSWRNRNVIKGANGPQWLTIPVGGATDRTIEEVPLPRGNWRQKHWRSLEQCYGKAPFFSLYEPFFRGIYEGEDRWTSLSELNRQLIEALARDHLGIRTRFARAADFAAPGGGEARVLALLRAAGAKTYVSGPAGQAYLEPAHFAAAGIELVWKDYSCYPEYPQMHPPFQHAVSIVDLLFNTGPEAADYIWGHCRQT